MTREFKPDCRSQARAVVFGRAAAGDSRAPGTVCGALPHFRQGFGGRPDLRCAAYYRILSRIIGYSHVGCEKRAAGGARGNGTDGTNGTDLARISSDKLTLARIGSGSPPALSARWSDQANRLDWLQTPSYAFLRLFTLRCGAGTPAVDRFCLALLAFPGKPGLVENSDCFTLLRLGRHGDSRAPGMRTEKVYGPHWSALVRISAEDRRERNRDLRLAKTAKKMQSRAKPLLWIVPVVPCRFPVVLNHIPYSKIP
jgi:hypothetical protein